MQIPKQDYVSKQTEVGVGIKVRWGGASGSGPGMQAELTLEEKLTINMARLFRGVRKCLLAKRRHSLPAPGDFSRPKGPKEASPGCPHHPSTPALDHLWHLLARFQTYELCFLEIWLGDTP